MQSEHLQTPTADLREVIGIVRRRKWVILFLTVLVTGGALLYSFRQTPIYASTTEVLVKPTSLQQGFQAVPATGLINLDNEKALVQSPSVATLAAERLGGGAVAGDLLSKLSVSEVTNTQLLQITFSDPAPAAAQKGAQAFAEAYLEFRRQQALQAFAQTAGGVRREIGSLQSQLRGLGQRLASTSAPADRQQIQNQIDLLNGQIALLQSQLAQLSSPSVDPGEIVAPANLPTAPASPNTLRDGLVGFIMGLALGVAVAFLRERVDDQIGTREELEAVIGAPTLAVVPRVPGWRKRDRAVLVSVKMPKSGLAEAYRTIRTNLQFIARSNDLKILSVTSPLLGEGKTTTVANLAVTLAHGGKRVIALSCDLRRPRLHRFFDLPNEVGLTSILSGQASVREAAQRCDVDGLRIIASGPIPPDPAELLDSDEMDDLLKQLRAAADFLLIDTVPVLAVSDSLIMAARSDGVLLVADAGSSGRSPMAHAREQLEQVGAKIVGGVFNNFDPSKSRSYHPYYRYYYAYQYRVDGDRHESQGRRQSRSLDAEEMWR